MVGLSEIFQPDYQSTGLVADLREHQTPNNNGTRDELSAILDKDPLADPVNVNGLESNLPLQGVSQNSSLLAELNDQMAKGLVNQAGRSNKPST